jgi:cytochrome c-type biogenesis protein CcmE
MNRKAKKRLIYILCGLLSLSLGLWLILANLEDNIVFFYTPSQIDKISTNKLVRIGGLVKNGSINNNYKDHITIFIITDNQNEIKISYCGILPALFREGQGIVAKGYMDKNKTFIASELLAKHDEKYKP